ncbi:MAG: dockerin type I repeat-containing protein [Clostridia bacterium]|nr:dockerin type I repeat-containing protein [Clostridia bacterium]
MKRSILFVLIFSLLFTMTPIMTTAASAVVYGDIDGDTKVSSTDALVALQSVVGKVQLSDAQIYAGDVDASKIVNAQDALMILKYVVGKISVFPAKEINGDGNGNGNDNDQPDPPTPPVDTDPEAEKLYYAAMDAQYKVNYSQFDSEIVELTDSEDSAAIVEALGGNRQSADVSQYGLNLDNRLSYTPISNEAKRLGKTAKYDGIAKVTGVVQAGNTCITYAVPKNATAYDAVPIAYSVNTNTPDLPVHFEATAFEDVSRYQTPTSQYLDCNLPGIVNVSMSYEGYVNGERGSGAPMIAPDPTDDIKGKNYPTFDTTAISKTGTIKAGADYTWFKFKYTNTGGTILDGEGNSTFRFKPVLQKKNGSSYINVAQTPNGYYPLLDYVYPGESGEFWTVFQTGANTCGLEAGDYRIAIYGMLRNEKNSFNYEKMQVEGDVVTTSTFDFTVTANGGITTPNAVNTSTTASNGVFTRNNWLGDFEEFLSSYSSFLNVGTRTGIMYVQVAPWTDAIVLKVINGNSAQAACVRIPISVESDSISINLNPYNQNYAVKDDGTRTPMVMTQNMADMRGNVDRGPDCDQIILNELRNMKEAGVNTLTTTHAYTGENSGAYDMALYMLDCAKAMNFKLEGHALYYYRGQNAVSWVRASDRNINLGSGRDMFNLQQQDAANGILARWNMIRYGSMFHYDPITKEIPFSIEENYGWMTYNLNNRYGINTAYCDRLLYKWLQTAYDDDIDVLNRKYGSNYSDFNAIKVSTQGKTDPAVPGGDATILNGSIYKEAWNAATIELDLFRTAERTRYYEEFAKYVGEKGAKVYLRSENGVFLAPGIKETTTNPHYRQIYYEQFKAASVPEVLAASDVIYGDSSYSYLPLTDAEVYELTRQAAKAGFVTAKTPSFNHLTDIVVNPAVGTTDITQKYNTKSTQKACAIGRSASLFTWCKAIYEAGGVPGTMWQDYACDLYVTTTQYKELQFFTQKVNEMLSTKEGKAWATNIPAEELESPLSGVASDSTYSFSRSYISGKIASIPRKNIIMDFCK